MPVLVVKEKGGLWLMQKWGKCVALWKEEKAQPAAGGGDFITRPTNNFEKVANAFEIRVGTDYHHP